MHIKKGDQVVILSGDEKGKKGKVAHVMPRKGTAVVEGLNLKKKHQRSRSEGKKGQVIEVSMPLRVSKLALADKSNKK
ncbi:MAG: 50S ribosomal protein L24 [Parcubacteria group bacterium GW2011_GWA2_47_7]|nr:MAG: 50S ribosomal protein L24 [Parcubacteria group bacterium GW2011_GWA2_47_7]